MSFEIERKFLVKDESWKRKVDNKSSVNITQGYLHTTLPVTRVRVVEFADSFHSPKAFLTVKSETVGISRIEVEVPISIKNATTLLSMCSYVLKKKRSYITVFSPHILTWELDEFESGLVLAEVELEHEDQQIVLPPWIGKEVSQDPRYFNSNLVMSGGVVDDDSN